MTLDTSTIPEANIGKLILNGQSYAATTGQVTVGGTSITVGVGLFNPANSGKNILIYSLRFSNAGGSSMLNLYTITSDPAYASALTVNNLKVGGSASAIASHITYQNAATTVVGTVLDVGELPQASHVEQLTNGSAILLPSGSATGLAIYDFVANAQAWSATFKYVEF